METLAQRLFDAHLTAGSIKVEIEDKLEELGVPFDDTSFDWYDESIELKIVSADYRLSMEAQLYLYEAGFLKVYVNHVNGWETHYSYKAGEPFLESSGWRVSYPHKRGDPGGPVWVEKIVDNWPPEWFESGYCVVKELNDGK